MGFWNKEEDMGNLAEIEKKAEMQQRLKGVIIFPGTIKEYEDFMKYERGKVEVIDTGFANKGVSLWKHSNNELYLLCDGKFYANIEFTEKLFDAGLEALVQSSSTNSESTNFYGLPVKKKNDSAYGK